MSKIDIAKAEVKRGCGYPAPFDRPCVERVRQRLGDAGGLKDFGINLLTLPPGVWSSQRHWHSQEDEFVYVLSGELVLVTDDGEQAMHAGDCAAFPKGVSNGHHLINRSDKPATCLEVGTRAQKDRTVYPDVDLIYDENVDGYTDRKGKLYPARDG